MTKHGPRRRGRALLAIVTALLLLASACGDDDDTSNGDAANGDAAPAESASGDDSSSDETPADSDDDATSSTEADTSGELPARTIYGGVGSLSSEYWAAYSDGAEIFTASLDNGSTYEALASDFDGQRHLDQFSTIFSQGCDDCVLAIDPASSAFTQAIVDEASAAGVSVTTLWNKPDEVSPSDDESGLWVAHVSFDGVDSGYRNAVALFESMGGEGNIVALQGILDNPPAVERFAGLQQALEEYPGITLLEDQVGNWSQTEGQAITEAWLSRYGDDIGGIWTANDGMALGAVEALRQAGKAGEVLVTGSDGSTDALELVAAGEMVSTMFIDGRYQGALVSAMSYAASIGELDPASLPAEQRAFYLEQTLVTQDNVDEILNGEVDASDYSWENLSADFWARSAGPLR